MCGVCHFNILILKHILNLRLQRSGYTTYVVSFNMCLISCVNFIMFGPICGHGKCTLRQINAIEVSVSNVTRVYAYPLCVGFMRLQHSQCHLSRPANRAPTTHPFGAIFAQIASTAIIGTAGATKLSRTLE